MQPEQILAKVSGICKEVFSEPGLQVSASTSAKDVPNWDSMTNLFLIDALEQQFGMKFKLDEIMNAQNIGDLCTIIIERGRY